MYLEERLGTEQKRRIFFYIQAMKLAPRKMTHIHPDFLSNSNHSINGKATDLFFLPRQWSSSKHLNVTSGSKELGLLIID